MADILAIGIAVVDLICEVEDYPLENDEVRALAHHRRRGGNAGNTLTVLSDLGHRCAFAGTLAEDAAGRFVRSDLAAAGIDSKNCRLIGDGVTPTSYITLSRANGSRTIVHYRDLPEYDAGDFAAIPLQGFDWIHFEGRNVAHTRAMLQRLRKHGFGGGVSVEIEKPRDQIESLYPLASTLIFSRHFASSQGFADGAAFLRHIRAVGIPCDLVCAWGERGAHGLAATGQVIDTAPCPPPQVVDTLGAGDVFNAGLIHGLLAGHDLAMAMGLASALAGQKCGRPGLSGLTLPEAV